MNFNIGSKNIGEDSRVFIIAELSANHNQSFEIAKKMVLEAKKVGADAIKLQTYTADTITIDCDNKNFRIDGGTLWDGKTLHQLYKEAYTPWEWQPELKKIAEDIGMICFSSPFDKTAVDFLEKMNVPAYKIASFEITDIPLIEYVASKKKPVIISTGIATIQEIKEAIEACKNVGNEQIALLKCTSSYPAPFDEVNLKTIPDMIKQFDTVVGLSDHTLGISVPIAAVVLGARIIEKHFILDRNIGGPDAAFSFEPKEFTVMVKSIRQVELALGKISYELSESVKASRHFSRSLYVVEDVKAGEIISKKNVRSIRPGNGLAPKYFYEIIGKTFNADYKKGTPLNLDFIN